MNTLLFSALKREEIDEVMLIECAVHSHPWTPGNFIDALHSGDSIMLLRDAWRQLVGYFVVKSAVDELELLNIAVHPDWQRRGIARSLLDRVADIAQRTGMSSVLLEVRPSNQRAVAVYERYGFRPIGRRKGYYPAPGLGLTREDAIVMRFNVKND